MKNIYYKKEIHKIQKCIYFLKTIYKKVDNGYACTNARECK